MTDNGILFIPLNWDSYIAGKAVDVYRVVMEGEPPYRSKGGIVYVQQGVTPTLNNVQVWPNEQPAVDIEYKVTPLVNRSYPSSDSASVSPSLPLQRVLEALRELDSQPYGVGIHSTVWECRVTRNGVFHADYRGNTPDNALRKALIHTERDLDCPWLPIRERNYIERAVGRKVWYKGVPSIITRASSGSCAVSPIPFLEFPLSANDYETAYLLAIEKGEKDVYDQTASSYLRGMKQGQKQEALLSRDMFHLLTPRHTDFSRPTLKDLEELATDKGWKVLHINMEVAEEYKGRECLRRSEDGNTLTWRIAPTDRSIFIGKNIPDVGAAVTAIRQRLYTWMYTDWGNPPEGLTRETAHDSLIDELMYLMDEGYHIAVVNGTHMLWDISEGNASVYRLRLESAINNYLGALGIDDLVAYCYDYSTVDPLWLLSFGLFGETDERS